MFESINLETIYSYIAWISTGLFIIKMSLFMLIGDDIEVHSDFNSMTDCDPSFNFFSIQSILSFLMGFGWMGLTLSKHTNSSTLIIILTSLAVGVVFMFIAAYLMFVIRKLEKKVVVKYEDYIGTEGKAYTNLKPNSKGQIQIVINNKLETLEVTSICKEEIQAFSPIKLVKVENNILYVDKI